MGSFSEKELKAVATIASLANSGADKLEMREQSLELVHGIFSSDSTIFWMTDENKMLVDPVFKHIQSQYLRPYHSYYYQQNPFDPTNLKRITRPSVTMEQLISSGNFRKSEYYNDFIGPQYIRRQMAIYIEGRDGLSAVLGLHRYKENAFEEKHLILGDIIANYLSTGLDRLDLISGINQKTDLFQWVCDRVDKGILILDHHRRELYRNIKAKKILKRLLSGKNTAALISDNLNPIPFIIREDCLKLEALSIRKHEIPAVLQTQRCIQVQPSERYYIKTELLSRNASGMQSTCFLVSLEENGALEKLDFDKLRNRYGFTKREFEIVVCTCKGYRNLEIAEELSISVGTVKNHLKHIFEKAELSSRTALIHRLMT